MGGGESAGFEVQGSGGGGGFAAMIYKAMPTGRNSTQLSASYLRESFFSDPQEAYWPFCRNLPLRGSLSLAFSLPLLQGATHFTRFQ